MGHKVLTRRICAQIQSSNNRSGLSTEKGVDYTVTFSPVVLPETLRLVLALSIEHPDIEVEQLDIVTAFLYGELNEDIYMNTPKGENLRSKGLVEVKCVEFFCVYFLGIRKADKLESLVEVINFSVDCPSNHE